MGRGYEKLVDNLNSGDAGLRLESLKKLKELIEGGKLERPESGGYVNNHIHTIYSFSPYSPSKAAWMAYCAGLTTAGIVDHDSVGGVEEFIEAGRIIGIATTIGMECRVDFSKTPLRGRRLNNPDQESIAYVTLHGIPHTRIDTVRSFLEPYKRERDLRNRRMCEKINQVFSQYGISIDYDRDVVPLSKSSEGGTVTERHISYALSLKMIEKYGKGPSLLEFLKKQLKVNVSPKVEGYLLDLSSPCYDYDLLGLIKSDVISSFYIDAAAECPDVEDFIRLARETGSIAAYAYLGDVGESVTGDKKAQKFEDDYLDLLMEVIRELGFNAVTYMPSRNTLDQLKRVKELCGKHGFFEISGEDINSPRQSFVCRALEREEFKNLIDSTWALIGHEKAATEDLSKGMFSSETVRRYPDLRERIAIYRKMGMRCR